MEIGEALIPLYPRICVIIDKLETFIAESLQELLHNQPSLKTKMLFVENLLCLPREIAIFTPSFSEKKVSYFQNLLEKPLKFIESSLLLPSEIIDKNLQKEKLPHFQNLFRDFVRSIIKELNTAKEKGEFFKILMEKILFSDDYSLSYNKKIYPFIFSLLMELLDEGEEIDYLCNDFKRYLPAVRSEINSYFNFFRGMGNLSYNGISFQLNRYDDLSASKCLAYIYATQQLRLYKAKANNTAKKKGGKIFDNESDNKAYEEFKIYEKEHRRSISNIIQNNYLKDFNNFDPKVSKNYGTLRNYIINQLLVTPSFFLNPTSISYKLFEMEEIIRFQHESDPELLQTQLSIFVRKAPKKSRSKAQPNLGFMLQKTLQKFKKDFFNQVHNPEKIFTITPALMLELLSGISKQAQTLLIQSIQSFQIAESDHEQVSLINSTIVEQGIKLLAELQRDNKVYLIGPQLSDSSVVTQEENEILQLNDSSEIKGECKIIIKGTSDSIKEIIDNLRVWEVQRMEEAQRLQEMYEWQEFNKLQQITHIGKSNTELCTVSVKELTVNPYPDLTPLLQSKRAYYQQYLIEPSMHPKKALTVSPEFLATLLWGSSIRVQILLIKCIENIRITADETVIQEDIELNSSITEILAKIKTASYYVCSSSNKPTREINEDAELLEKCQAKGPYTAKLNIVGSRKSIKELLNSLQEFYMQRNISYTSKVFNMFTNKISSMFNNKNPESPPFLLIDDIKVQGLNNAELRR